MQYKVLNFFKIFFFGKCYLHLQCKIIPHDFTHSKKCRTFAILEK
jgi:hypothetical protein